MKKKGGTSNGKKNSGQSEVTPEEAEKFFSHFEKIKELGDNKFKGNPSLLSDLEELKNQLQELIKNKKTQKHFKGRKTTGRRDFLVFLASIKDKEVSKFYKVLLEFEKKHGVTLNLVDEDNGEKTLCVLSFLPRFLLLEYFMVYDISNDGMDIKLELKHLNNKHVGQYISKIKLQKLGSLIEKIRIYDTSKTNNLLRNLSLKLDQHFPTVITYESPSAHKTFLLSIPQNCNMKNIVDIFSGSITAIHSAFFKTKPGRRSTKRYYQLIFDKEFPILKEKGYTNERAFREIATLFKEEHNYEISWSTVSRNYYQPWKKKQKGTSRKKKVGIKR